MKFEKYFLRKTMRELKYPDERRKTRGSRRLFYAGDKKKGGGEQAL